MFAKIFTLATLVAAVAAIPAAPAPLSPPAAAPAPTVNTCNVGTLQCCESLQAANSQSVQQLAQGNALLAAALGIAPVTVPVGLTCSPLSIAALGGNSWLVFFLFPLYLHYADFFPALPNPSAARTIGSVSNFPIRFPWYSSP